MSGRPYTSKEIRILRESFGRVTAAAVAKRIGRSASGVHQAWVRLGLSAKRRDPGPLQEYIREKHAIGWSDGEIALAWGVQRSWVSEQRRRLGLGNNRRSAHCRAKVAEQTKKQVAQAGVKSLAQVRRLAFDEFAKRHGWPSDLRPRAVQILDLLYQYGLHTRRQIAEAIGMPWKGSRKSLVSNDAEGSYLAHLAARGLVVRSLRVVRGRGKGGSCDLYSIAPGVKRGPTCHQKH